ncbi:MAG TPA: hypothetical protein VF498_14145, partial [Anaerolineales bacterium]
GCVGCCGRVQVKAQTMRSKRGMIWEGSVLHAITTTVSDRCDASPVLSEILEGRGLTGGEKGFTMIMVLISIIIRNNKEKEKCIWKPSLSPSDQLLKIT